MKMKGMDGVVPDTQGEECYAVLWGVQVHFSSCSFYLAYFSHHIVTTLPVKYHRKLTGNAACRIAQNLNTLFQGSE